jgi:lipoate-protein ligase A
LVVLRVLDFEVGDPYWNMAIDEAVAKCVGEGKSPQTLRLYGWSPSAVSIGFFQEAEVVVDLEFCRKSGIDVVRRITGGGAVLHTQGELTYSLALNMSAPHADVLESFESLCRPVVSAIRRLGVDAVFRPINDIEVCGRKVSGSAQTRKFGAILQHGTILLELDRSFLRALRVEPEKLRARGISDVAERVTTLNSSLSRSLAPADICPLLIEEFQKGLCCGMVSGGLTDEERRLLPSIRARLMSPEWLLRR